VTARGASLDHFAIGGAAAWLRTGAAPDGLMCTSDLIAPATRRVLAEAGVAPPAIWGFDGGPLDPWIASWLCSVALPCEAIGLAMRDRVTDAKGGRSGRLLPFTLRRATPAGATAPAREPPSAPG
jgi:DNA-binding LacI/PurR family transcriptional regulator